MSRFHYALPLAPLVAQFSLATRSDSVTIDWVAVGDPGNDCPARKRSGLHRGCGLQLRDRQA